MAEFDKIYLVWRKGPGSRRHAVGALERKPDGSHVFSYNDEAETLKQEEGFTPYTEFPDLTRTYNGNVADIFGQRLVKTDRPDSRAFFDFWEADQEKLQDKFYLLGKTQGLVATDNFEFLADYHLCDETHFVTEIAGLSVIKPQLLRGDVEIGDVLTYELETDNEKDQYAVKVYDGTRMIGYIKKFHNKIFHQRGAESLTLTVKAMEQNGVIKRIFVKVAK
jgi:hypothetical protein